MFRSQGLAVLVFGACLVGCDVRSDQKFVAPPPRDPPKEAAGNTETGEAAPRQVIDEEFKRALGELKASLDELSAEVKKLNEVISHLESRVSGKNGMPPPFKSTGSVFDLRKKIRKVMREYKLKARQLEEGERFEEASEVKNLVNYLDGTLQELEEVEYEEDYLDWKDQNAEYLYKKFGIVVE